MKLKVYDIETLLEEFSITLTDVNGENPVEFRINQWDNQIDGLVKHLTTSGYDYMIGFNNVNFDGQVLQYIINNHQKWYDKGGKEIAALISQFADDVIDDINNGVFPPYRERTLWCKQIDLFKIFHFDNENRRTSLKWIEFSVDMEDIEEMPFHHKMVGLTQDHVMQIDLYRRNDVKATCVLYNYATGNVKSEIYKGQDKIQDRLETIAEFKLPQEAMNWSDVKIGDELNKLGYMQLKGIKDPKKLEELKRKRGATKPFTYGECIPEYVKFKTQPFIDFYERIKGVKVALVDKKQKFPFEHNGTKYTIAKGGIHSTEKNRIVEPTEDELLLDADVGSQYPNAIFKRKLYPRHLGPEWLVMYGNTITRRLDFKTKGKENKRYEGLAGMLKLALNGGGFGKTNEKTNWQYDPFVHFSCTIGNQFEILMLIETLEMANIHVISANTDGIVCLFDKKLADEYYRICHEWEEVVGNTAQGKLEYSEYSKMVQASVNDYLAVKKKDGSVKKKGDFMTEFELNKNKSYRIFPIAYENYFVKGIPVDETIVTHDNIYDFCAGVKSSRNYHYETFEKDSAEGTVHNKIIRYYVSKTGVKLLKIKNEGSEATGPDVSNCEARDHGHWYVTPFNRYEKKADYNLQYQFYIENAQNFVTAVQRPPRKKGAKKVIVNKQQISMF